MKCLLKVILLILIASSCNTNKKAIDIQLSSRKIELGDSIQLSWLIDDRNIKKITIEGINDDADKQGSLTLKPDTTTMYRFVMEQKKDKPIRKTFKVNVMVPKVNYFMGPTDVTDEQHFEVRWSVSDASRIFIEDYRNNLEPMGKINVRLDSSRLLRIYAVNKFGHSDSKTLDIEVKLMEKFKAPDEIYIGDTAIISWKYKLAQYVQLDGLDKQFKTTDSVYVSPQQDTTFNFTILQNDGTDRVETHDMKVLPPTILYLDAPKYVSLGSEATLSWEVRGAKKVSIEGIVENLPAKGRFTVKPSKTTSYKLIIQRDDFTTYKTVTVNVSRNRKFASGVVAFSQLTQDERIDMEIFDVDYSAYPDKVTLKLLAVDSKGRFVTGLSKNSKKFFPQMAEIINSKEYAISSFGVQELYEDYRFPFNVSIAIDKSASLMNIVDSLDTSVKMYISQKLKEDRLAITKFADSISVLVPLTNQKQTVLIGGKFNGELSQSGSTALYAGSDCALKLFDDADANKYLIVFTDGKESSSFIYKDKFEVTVDGLIKQARKKNVKIIWVAYGDGVNRNIANQIAWKTGGQRYLLNHPADIRRVYNELAFIYRNYYEISYKPVKADGNHKIALTYHNLINAREKAETEYFIGTELDVLQYDFLADDYWAAYVPANFTIISPPQSAAYFEFDDSELLDVYKSGIMKFVGFMKENKDAVIRIFGHTDLKGSEAYCMNLSKERAEMIKNYLIANDIEEKRIEIIKCGQKYPVWEAEVFDWQSNENRRIELLLAIPKIK